MPTPSGLLPALDAAALRRWCAAGVAGLRAAREEIDALNVYPVPDGDTGTNLLLTLESVEQALQGAGADLAATVTAFRTGSLLGARGNSGVILSQLLRGLGEALLEGGGGAEQVRAGLRRGADLAWAAVAAPVEGTVLSVARAAADGAVGEDLADVVCRAREAAVAALARTPEQLPVLHAAGVVDAGGRGWCVLLEALEHVVTGQVAALPPPPVVARGADGAPAVREAGSAEFAYEVQYLLSDSTDEAVAALREQLSALGDSLVVVGADGLWNVHVHVNDVGAALEAGVQAGRPSRVTVTRFADQTAPPPGPVMNERPAQRAVVAVAAGAGLGAVFRDAGAAVVDGGPTANPSTAEVLAAVRATGAREVLVLPNDGNVLAVAAQAASAAVAEGVTVEVVPTRAVVQGLAALAVVDDAAPLAEVVAAVGAAAAATRAAELTVAVRDAGTAAGPCHAGDALGLLDGEVVVVAPDLAAAALALLDRLLAPSAELVTVVAGADCPPGLAEQVAERARAAGAEVTVYEGGQPHHPLLLGAE